MYNFKHMMTELEINATEFRQICVSSGTDYNSEHIPLFKILNTFKKYRIKNNDENIDFLKWITSDTKYFNNTSIDELRNIENMFKNLSITTDNNLTYGKTYFLDGMVKDMLWQKLNSLHDLTKKTFI